MNKIVKWADEIGDFFVISILLWIMLLFRPEETKQALTEMTKNLEENIYF